MPRYIDADAIYENLIAFSKKYNYSNTAIGYAIGYVMNVIDNANTADVRENVHGKWIEKAGQDWTYSKEYNCSVCGKYRLVTNPAGCEWNYCPNCGAVMVSYEEWKQRKGLEK